MRKSRTDQRHVVNIITVRLRLGGPAQHAWQCTTCGDHEVFTGHGSLKSAWTTAQMHVHLWGGEIA